MSLEADRAGVTIEVGLDIHPLSFDISVRIEPPFAGSTTVCQDFHPALTILDAQLMVDRGNVMDYSLILGVVDWVVSDRSEEHTHELQSLMRSSYAVYCLKKKT